MRRILVPTDLSPLSTDALHVASRIARRMGAELFALKVVPVHGGASYDEEGELVPADADDITPFRVQRDLDRAAIAPWAEQAGMPVHTLVRFGPIADTILKVVDTFSIDLLVIGTRGGSGLRDRLVGLLVEHLIGRADIPILSVKDDLSGHPIHRVLFANAFERAPQYFDVLRDLHDRAGCTFELLRVNTPSARMSVEDAHRRMDAFANDNGLQRYSRHVLEAPTVEQGVMRWTEEHGADLIAIRTLGRTGFARLVRGCVSLDLVNTARTPILTIRVR